MESLNKFVDINSDLGEGFGHFKAGNDDEIMKIVTSANVACGSHAGDPDIMAQTFSLARERNINVGAHPGFPDLWGFGRRNLPFSLTQIEHFVAYQVGAAMALSVYSGKPITYVKPHGALGNLTQSNPDIAKAVCRAVKAVDDKLIMMTFSSGTLTPIAHDLGLKTCAEIFADRNYGDDGHLIPRSQPNAMVHDPKEAGERMLKFVQTGSVVSVSGKVIEVPIDTICVHGDGPHAVAMALEVRNTLEKAGITIKSFV